MRRQKIRELPLRSFSHMVVVTLPIILGVFWLSFHFVRPMPPRKLTMTTGTEGGSYAVLGERYRQVLARNGIQLQLLPSATKPSAITSPAGRCCMTICRSGRPRSWTG